MTTKLVKWAPNDGPIARSGLSDGRRAIFLPSVAKVAYDWLRIDGYLGNVGLNVDSNRPPALNRRQIKPTAPMKLANAILMSDSYGISAAIQELGSIATSAAEPLRFKSFCANRSYDKNYNRQAKTNASSSDLSGEQVPVDLAVGPIEIGIWTLIWTLLSFSIFPNRLPFRGWTPIVVSFSGDWEDPGGDPGANAGWDPGRTF